MKSGAKKQLIVLGVLLVLYALLAAAAFLATPPDQFAPPGQPVPTPTTSISREFLALANAGIVLVAYGLFGFAGYWFARKLEIPPVYREGAGWHAWFLWPLMVGLALGALFVVGDQVFARMGSGDGFPHPGFPVSLISSAAAGIGEEILFRGFVMGLWAWLFKLVLKKWHARKAVLWTGNVLAALAFAAGHLPSAMMLLNVTSPANIPTLILVELVSYNGIMGLVAGERYMRDGLVAAMGVHFWADVVWHVLWPLMGGMG